jgi:hypothetical protein
MTVEVFRARSEQDREELFRFRYAVYVQEMGRYRRTADHEGRRLIEPEDANSILYGARDEDGRVVGTSRLTFGADGFSARQIEQYSLGPFLSEVPARLMAIGERLMVTPSLRGSTVTAMLRELARGDVQAGGVRLVFGNCEPHLLSMNLAAGGRTYAERNINSEEAGYLIPLVFLDGDRDGLAAAIGSLDGDGRPCLPRPIEAALTGSDAVHSASLMAPGEYWAHVQDALERLDQEELHAFAGLDPAEVRECISRSNIIECAPGDRVLKEGGSAHNLFLLLEGTLEVRHHGRLVNVLGPGDVFGEMAFLLALPRQSDVFAATPGVRILSLSDGTLHKLMAEEPTLAAKLLFNISRMLCGRLIKANATAAADI